MTRAYKHYGEVFTVPVFHKKITFLIGPDVSLHFFKVRHPLGSRAAGLGG